MLCQPNSGLVYNDAWISTAFILCVCVKGVLPCQYTVEPMRKLRSFWTSSAPFFFRRHPRFLQAVGECASQEDRRTRHAMAAQARSQACSQLQEVLLHRSM